MKTVLAVLMISGVGTSPTDPDFVDPGQNTWEATGYAVLYGDNGDFIVSKLNAEKQICQPIQSLTYTESDCELGSVHEGEIRWWRHDMFGKAYYCNWFVPWGGTIGQQDYMEILTYRRQFRAPCYPGVERCTIAVGFAADLLEGAPE